jgi:hypothetical protein
MPRVLADEVFKKAQAGIRNRLLNEAMISDFHLRKLGEEIAHECGCRASFGPIKELESANRKVLPSEADGGYGGDWTQLKDVVRMTIIAPSAAQMIVVRDRIRAKCALGSGMRILKDSAVVPSLPSPNPGVPWNDKKREHDRALESCGYSAVNQIIWANTGSKDLKQDPCGYSGLNFVVRLANERPGEIQVNIPEMIYGKEKEKVAREAVGDALYIGIRNKFRIEGGLGHSLYEIYRVAPAGYIGRLAAQISRSYYAYLRGYPDMRQLSRLKEAVDEIKRKEPSKFLH